MSVLRVLSAVAATIVVTTTTIETSQNTAPAFPRRMDEYLAKSVKLTTAQRTSLKNGTPITKLVDVQQESTEISVFGAIWINAPMRRYVELVKDIENFERGGGFKVTKRISTPPALGDFDALHLAEVDLGDLRTCRVGDCILKLGEEGVRRFQNGIDWKAANSRAAADRVMRQLAFEYVTAYLEGGNARLAVYRDASRPTFIAQEFRAMVDEMPELTTYMPDIRRHLLEFPKYALPNSTAFLYWQETEFGLRPTHRISHVTIRETPDDTIVTSKMLYASHYFWTGLELRVLLADPSRGAGFWFLTVSRSRSDGLSGFTGAFIRPRARGEAQSGAMAALKLTKKLLEGSR
jgi:hypothetical protein